MSNFSAAAGCAILLLLVSIGIPTAAGTTEGGFEWIVVNEGSNRYFGAHVDPNGDIIVTGDHYFPPTDRDIVAKYNPKGQLQWQEFYESGDGRPFDVAADARGDIVICGTGTYWGAYGGRYVAFVAKYGSNGKFLWEDVYDNGTYDAYGWNVVVNDEREVILVGVVHYTGGLGQSFIRKYGPDRDLRYARTYDFGVDTQPKKVKVDRDGNIVYMGLTRGFAQYFLAKISGDDGALLETRFYGIQGVIYDMAIDRGENVIVLGRIQSPPHDNLYIRKHDSNLKQVEELSILLPVSWTPYAFGIDPAGNILIAGGGEGENINLAKCSENGDLLWTASRSFVGSTVASVEVYADNYALIAGGVPPYQMAVLGKYVMGENVSPPEVVRLPRATPIDLTVLLAVVLSALIVGFVVMRFRSMKHK